MGKPDLGLEIQLNLNGRPLRTYNLHQPVVTIGRESSSDIYLDNIGVSRFHARIEYTPNGWQLLDLGSANGTYIEGVKVDRAALEGCATIQVGKFSLDVVVPHSAGARNHSAPLPKEMFESTTRLTRGQLASVLAAAREAEPEPEAEVLAFPSAERSAATRLGALVRSPWFWVGCAVVAVALGFWLGRR